MIKKKNPVESPLRVFIHVTDRCDLKCMHCYLSCGEVSAYENFELSSTEICDLLHQVSSLGTNRIHIDGGEPFLRPGISQIVEVASSLGLETSIITNGNILNAYLLDSLAGKLDGLNLSLDGSTPSVHDYIRKCPGLYKKVVSNIALSSERGFKTKVWATVNKVNLGNALDLVTILRPLGVRTLGFFRCSMIGRAMRNKHLLEIPAHEWMAFCRKVNRLLESRDQLEIIYQPSILLADHHDLSIYQLYIQWSATQKEFHVAANGDVYSCGLFINTPFKLGNIRGQPFDSIIKSSSLDQAFEERYNKLRRDCEGCDSWDLCQGGCSAYAYHAFGSIMLKDPRCAKGIIPLCPIFPLPFHPN